MIKEREQFVCRTGIREGACVRRPCIRSSQAQSNGQGTGPGVSAGSRNECKFLVQATARFTTRAPRAIREERKRATSLSPPTKCCAANRGSAERELIAVEIRGEKLASCERRQKSGERAARVACERAEREGRRKSNSGKHNLRDQQKSGTAPHENENLTRPPWSDVTYDQLGPR